LLVFNRFAAREAEVAGLVFDINKNWRARSPSLIAITRETTKFWPTNLFELRLPLFESGEKSNEGNGLEDC
jgi:hypothetical protein